MEYSMHRDVVTHSNNLLMVKGLLAIIWGAAALAVSVFSSMMLVYSFGALNLIAALLTFGYAYSNRHLKISHQWLVLEGVVEMAAGIVFLLLVQSVEAFVQMMSYGIIFVVILQFMYGFMLVIRNQMHPINLIARFASVIAGTIISVGLLSNTFSLAFSFIVIGIFSIVYGVLNIQFSRRLNNIILGDAAERP